MGELECKARCVVAPTGPVCLVLLNAVTKVRDALPRLVPPDVLLLLALLRVNGDLHSEVEERVGFGVVHDVELDRLAFPRVLGLEEEPLGVAAGVDVVLHQQIILIVRNLLRQVQVTALKLGLEQERLV